MLVDALRARAASPVSPTIPAELWPVAPSLDGLLAVLPEPPELDAATWRARVRDAELAVLPRTPREPGSFAREGDEVELLAAALHADGVVPFSAGRLVIDAGGDAPWPGLAGAMVGVTPTQELLVTSTVPETWVDPAWRGRAVVLRVRVLSVTELHRPDTEDDPPEPDPALEAALAQGWEDELSAWARQEARNAALEALRARAPAPVPDAMVDREIWQRWADTEGQVLLGFDLDESWLAASHAAWQRDLALRAEITRRLQIALLLGAIVRDRGLVVGRDEARARVDALAARDGIDADAAWADLEADPAAFAVLVDAILRERVTELVRAATQVRWPSGAACEL